MKYDLNKLLEQAEKLIDQTEGIPLSDMPSISLYMDQLTSFMDGKLRTNARNPEKDKVLTRTMINNYAKNDLLPPPDKKRYSRDHVMLLVFIYYYKNILSIGDIQKFIGPLKKRIHSKDSRMLSLSEVYETLRDMDAQMKEPTRKDLRAKLELAKKAFPDVSTKDADEMRAFSFLSMIAYDVYLKKRIIEKMVDTIEEKDNKSS